MAYGAVALGKSEQDGRGYSKLVGAFDLKSLELERRVEE